jgi:uncharacterized membrane protein
MSPTTTIALLWIGFAGSHMLLSSLPLRQTLITRLGEDAFRGIYSLVSFLFFVPLVMVYFRHKHSGPVLWNLPVNGVIHFPIYLGMTVAFILLASSFAQRSPAAVLPGVARPHGVLRLTRHPLLMAFGLWGLLHLIANGFASDVVFFGGFAVFAVTGARHQDERKLALDPEYRDFYAATPFLPFTGSETMQGLRELSPVAVVIGIALTLVLRYYHAALFGG